MKLGRLGIWSSLDVSPAHETARFAARLDDLGYAALWHPEAVGRNGLVHSAWLLAHTTNIVIATGIVNIYARDPMAMVAAQSDLAEMSGGRFLLGMGVSHAKFVTGMRGHEYGKPVSTMRDYLTGMGEVQSVAPKPVERPPTVIAGLRPKMIELGGTAADGVHTLNVTPAHTAQARAIIGSGPMLCVEQKLVFETDPAKARATGRKGISGYLSLPNYLALWKELGFSDDDFSDGGSDRLVDALIGWGDEAALRQRIQEHLDAGASHVCFNPLGADGRRDDRLIELLAPARN